MHEFFRDAFVSACIAVVAFEFAGAVCAAAPVVFLSMFVQPSCLLT
jgi:hypothetical protein